MRFSKRGMMARVAGALSVVTRVDAVPLEAPAAGGTLSFRLPLASRSSAPHAVIKQTRARSASCRTAALGAGRWVRASLEVKMLIRLPCFRYISRCQFDPGGGKGADATDVIYKARIGREDVPGLPPDRRTRDLQPLVDRAARPMGRRAAHASGAYLRIISKVTSRVPSWYVSVVSTSRTGIQEGPRLKASSSTAAGGSGLGIAMNQCVVQA